MKMLAFALAMMVSMQGSLIAGPYWLKRYGTADTEEMTTVVQTRDGGYLCGGSWGDDENGHAWIVRLKSDGTIASQRRYGSKTWDVVVATALETPDGGVMVIGFVTGKPKTSVDGRVNGLVMRLDKNGKVKWQKIYQVQGWDASVYSGRLTADGGCVVAGSLGKPPDFEKYMGWVFKVDSLGTMQWQKQFDYGTLTAITYPEQTATGQFLCSGTSFYSRTPKYIDTDALIVLLDTDGRLVWQKRIGTEHAMDVFVSSRPLADGGFLSCGIYGLGGKWVARFNASGNLLWQKAIGGKTKAGMAIFSAQTRDGGFVVAGTYGDDEEEQDGSLTRLNSSGKLLWSRTVKAPVNTIAWTVWETTDGGFVSPLLVTEMGEGFDDGFVLRTDKSGNVDASCSNLISTTKGTIRTAAGKFGESNVVVSDSKATTLNGDIKAYTAKGAATTMCESYDIE